MKDKESRKLFNSVSDSYCNLYDQLNLNIKKYFNNHILDANNIRRVLDVGNGGNQPGQLFSDEVVKKIELFVGNDLNQNMLKRNDRKNKVASDALCLPFKNETFDTVIVQGLIHHIGLYRGQALLKRLTLFIENLIPIVEGNGNVYIIESTLPTVFEILERKLYLPFYFKILGRSFVPTFMFHYQVLQEVLDKYFICEIVEYKWIYELFENKWEPMAPTLYFEHFKLPVCFSPYKLMFYKARIK